MNEQVKRRAVALYLTFKDRSPTILQLVRFNTKKYLITFVLVGAIVFIQWLVAGWIVGALFMSFVAGAFCRDIGHFRRICLTWPFTREITDWAKVDALKTALDTRSGAIKDP